MPQPRIGAVIRAVGVSLLATALGVGQLGTAHADDLPAPIPVERPSFEEMLAAFDGSALTDRWFVEVDGNPQVKGGSAAAAKKAQDKAVAAAKAAGATVTVNRSYSSLWNGVSVKADLASAKKLAGTAGVRGVYPVVTVTRPAVDASVPNIDTARGMTGADVANTELGFTGRGVKVGVIDSGIDYNHPDLGGSGVNDQAADFPGERVAYGWDFVGDDYDAGGTDPAVTTPRPDAYPDDCMGHGSHVAGIVGADGEVTGVAPEVTFGAYRVFGCGDNASSDTDVILQAMERAYADGMDIINMSLGASFETWPTYPTAVVADRLVDAGVVMVVSQGNEGTAGTFSSGAPAVAEKVISVGSVDNMEYMADYVTSAAGTEYPFMGATGAPDPTGGETLTLVAADPVLACEPVPAAAGPDRALLISRGTCSFHEKTVNAQNAGYEAALIYNDTAGVINMTVEGETEITIPAVSLLQTHGAALAAEIAAGGGSTTIEFSAEPKRFPNPTGGYQSDFSSYGLAADLTLKPDVSAPGGSIYSTYPLEKGGHTTMGGTSMSAPHVAGAAALLLEARGDLAPLEVRRLLTNTADPFTWGLLGDDGYLEPVHRQGGGLIDIPQALTTTTSVTPQMISLGEGEAGPVTTTITVSNTSAEAVTYDLGVANGVATGGATDAISFYAAYADVEFTADSVTVPAGGTATVQVRIGEDFGEDGIIYGGWVTLTSDADQLVIPFAGLSGDYQALTALEFAATAFADGEDLFLAEPFHTYSMVGNDVPYVALYLAYPVSNLYIDVYRANADGSKGAKVHSNFINYAETLELGRLGDIATIAWDGTYQGNNGKNGKVRRVDNGSYVLELRVLKALGDPSNPAHWETVALDPVTIAYGDGADTSAGNGPKPKR